MVRTTKRFAIAAVVAGVVSVAAGTVAAQDYFFPLFSGYVDHVVPGDSPCGYSPVKNVTPSTYEDTLMLWYLCEDNRVIARRFFRGAGSTEVPKPVYLVSQPGAVSVQSSPLPPAPAPGVQCPAGFVGATNGGCVPPDHPLAVR
jgi:hypothetical protein